jgi:hypothetical protein
MIKFPARYHPLWKRKHVRLRWNGLWVRWGKTVYAWIWITQ